MSDDGAVAALDIGANTLVAVITSTGYQRRYDGRAQFEGFRETTEEIATLQEHFQYDTWSSSRIRRLYRRRTRRVQHLQDALIRDLGEWLVRVGVSEVLIGDLSGVLATHWSARVNAKIHLFWSHGRFCRRLHEVLNGEYGISIQKVDEYDSSSTCPDCGGKDIFRDGDSFICYDCSFAGHADMTTSENLLSDNVGSMARPAVSRENTTEKGHGHVPCLQWDDHRWRQRDHLTNKEPADRSTLSGKVAPDGESGIT